MPLLAHSTVSWQELKSDMTKPLKPHRPRSVFTRFSVCWQENSLFTWFLAHITAPLCPFRTPAS